MKKKRLILIDGHAMAFRAYYAYPKTLRTIDGKVGNAIYGFGKMLLSVINKLSPSHIMVAFDVDKPTFRHKEFPKYKAQRPKTEEELIMQFDGIKSMIKSLNMPIFEVAGFEADDVIGTLANKACELDENLEAVIVTGDKDAFQLINDRIKVYSPGTKKRPDTMYGEKEIRNRFGLMPKQIIDLKAFAGDQSDNIPGIRGVGPKTAIKLLQKFETVERVYEEIKEDSINVGKSILEKILNGKEDAIVSKKLVTIITDVPLSYDLKAGELRDYDKNRAVDFFKKIGFTTLIKSLFNDKKEQEVKDIFENSNQTELF